MGIFDSIAQRWYNRHDLISDIRETLFGAPVDHQWENKSKWNVSRLTGGSSSEHSRQNRHRSRSKGGGVVDRLQSTFFNLKKRASSRDSTDSSCSSKYKSKRHVPKTSLFSAAYAVNRGGSNSSFVSRSSAGGLLPTFISDACGPRCQAKIGAPVCPPGGRRLLRMGRTRKPRKCPPCQGSGSREKMFGSSPGCSTFCTPPPDCVGPPVQQGAATFQPNAAIMPAGQGSPVIMTYKETVDFRDCIRGVNSGSSVGEYGMPMGMAGMENWCSQYTNDEWGCLKWCQYALFLVLTTILLLAAAVLVIFWTLNYQGPISFDWDAKADQAVNLHPIMMVTGFITLSGFSTLTFRVCRCFKRLWVKLFHTIIHSLAIACIVVGFISMYEFYNKMGLHHFYSMHSWLGLVTIGLFALQFFLGFFSFLFLACCQNSTAAFRAKMVPIHAAMGLTTFFLAVATCLTGMTQEFAKLQRPAEAYQPKGWLASIYDRVWPPSHWPIIGSWLPFRSDSNAKQISAMGTFSNNLDTFPGNNQEHYTDSGSNMGGYSVPYAQYQRGGFSPGANAGNVLRAATTTAFPQHGLPPYVGDFLTPHFMLNLLTIVLVSLVILIGLSLRGPTRPDSDELPCAGWNSDRRNMKTSGSRATVGTY